MNNTLKLVFIVFIISFIFIPIKAETFTLYKTAVIQDKEIQTYTYKNKTYIDTDYLQEVCESVTEGGLFQVGYNYYRALKVDDKYYLQLTALTDVLNYNLTDKFEITFKKTQSPYITEHLINPTDKQLTYLYNVTTYSSSYNLSNEICVFNVQSGLAVNIPNKENIISCELIKILEDEEVLYSTSIKSNYIPELYVMRLQELEKAETDKQLAKFPHFYREAKYKNNTVKVLSNNKGVARILYDNGTTEEVKSNTLTLLNKNRINKDAPTEKEIEDFINTQDFTSSTKYLIFTDLNRQRVYILTRENNSWVLLKNLVCSSGLNNTPTPTGTYKLTRKVSSFGQNHGYCCKNAFGFIGTTYLFHSILFDKTGTYLLEGKGVLGQQASQGCIRFSPEDAKWFYNTLEAGTTVIIW